MDHKEEQNNEIEALDSIYCGEMEILTKAPYHIFVIPVKSDDYEENGNDGFLCRLKFEYTSNYPEEPLIVDFEDADRLEKPDQESLRDYLNGQMQENLGMVMVFTLVSATQEWLNCQSDKRRKKREEHEERRLKAEEEAERKRFEGTVVTVETFLSWKQAFDIERGALLKKEKDEKNKKLTGRELFMTDKSLIESDLKFLEEAGGTAVVKVDESLFQDLDELDIDEEFDDD